MYIYNVIIFIIVLLLYTHAVFHQKTSNDMEIYDIGDYMSNRFNDICDQRQPVVFKTENIGTDELSIHNILRTHGSFMANIRNNDKTKEEYLYIETPIKDAIHYNRTKENTLFENNHSYMKESGLYSHLFEIEKYLRPPMVCDVRYDIMSGHKNAKTPLRYDISYRTFLLCKSGKIRLKLAPPNSECYLNPILDYENFEFRSDVDPWISNSQEDTYLETTMLPGDGIYIPSYWWHSICYEETDSVIYKLSYKTYMNIFTISPYIALHYLQLLNIRYKIAPLLDMNQGDTI